MTSDDRTVFIAVVGDSGVGKTSLITAAATETFPDHPPPVLPPAKLPADTTPEGVPVVITDTSSRPEDKQALELACQEASVIVLCFSMEKPQTLRRVSTFWMPELRRLGVTVPIMLVGCKSDVRPADQSLHQAVIPIVKTFPQIETCMECSARKLQFVGEVFYYALKAVVHPMAPLYEPEAQQLRPLCARALKRIFMLCDRDRDGSLSDAELNAFQVHCFNAPLQPEELVGVKAVVAEKIPQGILRNGLSLSGFLFLHALFIERGRLETTWAVLRRFGYNNDLRLSDEVLDRVSFAHSPDQVVELTEAGRAFFQSAFERFDVDDDNVLSTREREEMFSAAPEDPWKTPAYASVLVETSRKGLLTLPGYLALWAHTTAVDPRATLAGALYLGYPADGQADRLFQISRPRRQERRMGDPPRRGVLQCHVFAGVGVDPTPVLEGLITQARPTHGVPSAPVSAAVAAVPLPAGAAIAATGPSIASATTTGAGGSPGASTSSSSGSTMPANGSSGGGASTAGAAPAPGGSVTLIMESLSESQARVLLESPTRDDELQRCDVAAFVFDAAQPDSFRSAVELMVAVASCAGDALPCLFVALNDGAMKPALVAEVGTACSSLAIKPPVPLPSGAGGGSIASVYQAVVQTALQPELAFPETPSLRAIRQYRRMLRRAAIYTAGGTVAVLAGYFAYRVYKQHQAGGSAGEGDAPAAREQGGSSVATTD